eukprot:gene36370-biopygen21088
MIETSRIGKGLAVAVIAGTAIWALAPSARAAETWGIENEKVVKLQGKVVDLACELRHDCPADCGAGERQLGLLTSDGKLRPAVKGNAEFAGTVVDLAPLCGKTIEVDGLLIENPAAHILMVQAWRETPAAAWTKAEAFLTLWTKHNSAATE